MTEKKDELQSQVSQLIHQNIVNIVGNYSSNSTIDLDLILTLIQDINLLKVYKVKYTHNHELDEIINILRTELKEKNAANISLLTVFDFLLQKEESLKKAIYENLFSKVHQDNFMDAFSIFAVLNPTVKDLYSDFMSYIFDDVFLDLNEELQIDYIYKAWNFSQHLFHDNEASQFAYEELKILFDKAIEVEKTEVAFWLYYTPLHNFNSGTDSDINKVNEKFKQEIEKPLEKYIQKILIPKYNLIPNTKIFDKTKKIKVAFVMQRIINHSTINVFYSLVKSIMQDKNREYEFVIYDLSFSEAGGSDLSFVEEFKKLGIEYINLHKRIVNNTNATYSLLEKCIKTRKILIEEKVDIFIGLHTRIEYIFLYATRTTPTQIYWYHSSNAEYHIDGIDKRITHGAIPESGLVFNHFDMPMDLAKYNPSVDMTEVKKIKATFPKNSFILGTIGRLIKLDNDEYLKTVSQIMKENPKTIYLACGSGDKEGIQKKLESLEILDKFYFTGYVDSHVYGHVIDLWLETFPSNNGESLYEYLYKKNFFIKFDNRGARTKEELEDVRYPLFGKYCWTRTLPQYIENAKLLINDTKLREKVSENLFVELFSKNYTNSFISGIS